MHILDIKRTSAGWKVELKYSSNLIVYVNLIMYAVLLIISWKIAEDKQIKNNQS